MNIMRRASGEWTRLTLELVSQGESAEEDRQDTASHHAGEYRAPAPAVRDPADSRARECGAERVTEDSRESRGGAGRLLRHEVKRVQADDHDRTVDEKADRDECRVVDPQRPPAVQPVHDDAEQREGHEED